MSDEVDITQYRKRYSDEPLTQQEATNKVNLLEGLPGVVNARKTKLPNGKWQVSWYERIQPITLKGLGG